MNLRLSVLVSIVLAAALYRLMPHPFNFAPISAIALFAGAQFADKKLAFLLPLLSMLVADFFLGLHSTMIFIYSALALTVLIGMLIKNRLSIVSVVLSCISASGLFFIVSNFGTWLMTDIYPASVEGLVQCFILAIPFYTNSFLSDAFFALIFFGGFAIAESKLPQLRESNS